MDKSAVLNLLSTVGAFGLSGTDGCICGEFAVQGVCVEIACRKSGGSSIPDFYGTVIRVSSSHMDAELPDLQEIADVVARQAREANGNEVRTIVERR